MAVDNLKQARQQLAAARAAFDAKNEEANALRAELAAARDAHGSLAEARAEIDALNQRVALLESSVREAEKQNAALERQAAADAAVVEAARSLRDALNALSR